MSAGSGLVFPVGRSYPKFVRKICAVILILIAANADAAALAPVDESSFDRVILPGLIRKLERTGGNDVLQELRALGPHARPAVPALQRRLRSGTGGDPKLIELILVALSTSTRKDAPFRPEAKKPPDAPIIPVTLALRKKRFMVGEPIEVRIGFASAVDRLKYQKEDPSPEKFLHRYVRLRLKTESGEYADREPLTSWSFSMMSSNGSPGKAYLTPANIVYARRPGRYRIAAETWQWFESQPPMPYHPVKAEPIDVEIVPATSDYVDGVLRETLPSITKADVIRSAAALERLRRLYSPRALVPLARALKMKYSNETVPAMYGLLEFPDSTVSAKAIRRVVDESGPYDRNTLSIFADALASTQSAAPIDAEAARWRLILKHRQSAAAGR